MNQPMLNMLFIGLFPAYISLVCLFILAKLFNGFKYVFQPYLEILRMMASKLTCEILRMFLG